MTGPQNLEQAVDEVIFRIVRECPDERAREFLREYDEAANEVNERYARWKKESLHERVEYHRACAARDPESAAKRDVDLLDGAVREERDQLIAHHWKTFLERLRRVLEDVKDRCGGNANSGSPPAPPEPLREDSDPSGT